MQSGPHPPEWFHDTHKATTIIVSSIFEPLHGMHIGKTLLDLFLLPILKDVEQNLTPKPYTLPLC